MKNKKGMLIIIGVATLLSAFALIFTYAYEKETIKRSLAKENEPKFGTEYRNAASMQEGNSGNGRPGILNNVAATVFNRERTNKLVSSIISDYYYFINTNQYEKAYKMLNEDYRNEFGVNFNKFKATVKDEGMQRRIISSIVPVMGDEIISVEYFLLKENGFIKKEMSLLRGNDAYSVTLNGLTGIKDILTLYEENGLKITITKRYSIGRYIAYKVIIENLTSKSQYQNHPQGYYGVYKNKNMITRYYIQQMSIREIITYYKVVSAKN